MFKGCQSCDIASFATDRADRMTDQLSCAVQIAKATSKDLTLAKVQTAHSQVTASCFRGAY